MKKLSFLILICLSSFAYSQVSTPDSLVGNWVDLEYDQGLDLKADGAFIKRNLDEGYTFEGSWYVEEGMLYLQFIVEEDYEVEIYNAAKKSETVLILTNEYGNSSEYELEK